MSCIIRDGVLIVPTNISSIQDNEFSNNRTFSSIYFEPRDYIGFIIGNYAFDGCNLTGSITIPYFVTEIKKYAFHLNRKITSVIFEPVDYTLIIGENAFNNCNIQTLLIPKHIIKFGRGAFQDNMGLSVVDFEYRENNNPLVISDKLFYNCDIRKINIPPFITEIRPWSFFRNQNLTSIIFEPRANKPLELKIGDSAFTYCNIGKKLIIPYFVTVIGNCAFCLNLNLIYLIFEYRYIPIVIGQYAFESCLLAGELIIHPNTYIANYAFADNINLKKVIISKEYILIAEKIFKNKPKNIKFLEYYGNEHNQERRVELLIVIQRIQSMAKLLPWLPENKMQNILKILSLRRYNYLIRKIQSFI